MRLVRFTDGPTSEVGVLVADSTVVVPLRHLGAGLPDSIPDILAEGADLRGRIMELAAGMAHEIGNPIAAIMGMHDIIDEKGTAK